MNVQSLLKMIYRQLCVLNCFKWNTAQSVHSLLLDSWLTLPLSCYSNRRAILSERLLAFIFSKIIQTKSAERTGRNRGSLKITKGLERERFPRPVVPLRPACALSPGQVRRAAAWSCKTKLSVCSKQFPYKSNIKPCWRCSPSGPRSSTLNRDHVELSPQTRAELRSASMVHLKG